jgi:hypothetical protein
MINQDNKQFLTTRSGSRYERKEKREMESPKTVPLIGVGVHDFIRYNSRLLKKEDRIEVRYNFITTIVRERVTIKKYYTGVVKQSREVGQNIEHYIHFLDGDKKWLNLNKKIWKFVNSE